MCVWVECVRVCVCVYVFAMVPSCSSSLHPLHPLHPSQVGLPLFEVKLDHFDLLTYVLMDNNAMTHYESTGECG